MLLLFLFVFFCSIGSGQSMHYLQTIYIPSPPSFRQQYYVKAKIHTYEIRERVEVCARLSACSSSLLLLWGRERHTHTHTHKRTNRLFYLVCKVCYEHICIYVVQCFTRKASDLEQGINIQQDECWPSPPSLSLSVVFWWKNDSSFCIHARTNANSMC